MNAMKKARKYITITAALLLSVAAQAQIYIATDEDYENSLRTGSDGSGLLVPNMGLDADQSLFVPLGGGWLLLAGMGAAYLMHKRRKDDE